MVPGYVVRVERGDTTPPQVIGTGIVVGPRAVLTCWHVVKLLDSDVPLQIVTEEGRSATVADFSDKSQREDLALLRLDEDIPETPARLLGELTAEKIDAVGGYPVVAFGYPGGVGLEHAPLRPSDLRANYGSNHLAARLYGLGPLLPHGLSGGPLTVTIDREAYLLGMSRRGGASPAFEAAPADALIQFLAERGVVVVSAPVWTSLGPTRNAEVKRLLSLRREKKVEGDADAVGRIDNQIREILGGLDALAPGAVFASRFRFLRRIGTGGMSSVWLAEDFECSERTRVAVKILRSDAAQQTALFENFDRGAEVLKDIQHPNIVRLVEAPADHEGVRYYVMEHVDAPCLGELPPVEEQGGLSWDAVASVLSDIGSALDHLHKQGAVHRDVTPANILVRRDGEGRSEGILVDFDTILTETSKQLTVLKAGTGGYVAPEVRDDPNQASPRSDQYALAKCVLAAFGQVADEHRSIDQALAATPIGTGARTVLRQALAKEPLDRYPSVRAFVGAFKRKMWSRCEQSLNEGLFGKSTLTSFQEFSHQKSGLTLILIPGGTFTMGSEGAGAGADEGPLTQVTLSPYFLAKDEVTWAQYRLFCLATGRFMPTAPPWLAESWGGQDDRPMVRVSWADAKAYCDWAGLSLPTEAQWEYAARGPEGWMWPWGGAVPTSESGHARMDLGFGEGPLAVGRFPKGNGPFGHRDLGGNVWEWCADWYSGSYTGVSAKDPSGPATGNKRVFRGGCWRDSAWQLRGSFRSRGRPSVCDDSLGFRPSLLAPSALRHLLR